MRFVIIFVLYIFNIFRGGQDVYIGKRIVGLNENREHVFGTCMFSRNRGLGYLGTEIGYLTISENRELFSMSRTGI